MANENLYFGALLSQGQELIVIVLGNDLLPFLFWGTKSKTLAGLSKSIFCLICQK
jgi:hypothetical protein